MIDTSLSWGIPCFQFGVLYDSPLPISDHKSGVRVGGVSDYLRLCINVQIGSEAPPPRKFGQGKNYAYKKYMELQWNLNTLNYS